MNPKRMYAALKMKARGMVENWIKHGVTDKAGNIIGPSLREALTDVAHDLANFTLYAYSRRAQVLHGRTKIIEVEGQPDRIVPDPINPGMSLEDANHNVEVLRTDEFENAVQALTDWSGALIDYLVEAGTLRPDAAAAIRAINPIYVPLQRVMDNMSKSGVGTRGYANQPSGIRKIWGSSRIVKDILETTIQQAENLILLGNKALVAKSIVDLSEHVVDKEALRSIEAELDFLESGVTPTTDPTKKPSASRFAQKVAPPHMKKIEIALGEVKKQLEDSNIELGPADLEQVLTVFRQSTLPKGSENIVAIWRKGQIEHWQLDKDVYKVVMEMDKEVLPPIVRMIFGPFKRMVQLGAVGLSPGFSLVRNPIRDSMQLLIYSKGRVKHPFGAIQGIWMNRPNLEALWKELKKDPAAQRWLGMGGQMSTIMGQDRLETKRRLEQALAKGWKGQTMMTFKHPIDALRQLLSFPESGPRIVMFKKMFEEGMRKWGDQPDGEFAAAIYAMEGAQDVTVNFTRSGYLSAALNGMIPFFNPRIQGAAKFYRVFSGREGWQQAATATANAIAWITIPAMVLWLLNKDDDWYQELPDWERGAYWHFKDPFTGTIMRIPKPFELGYVFGSMPEAVVNSAYKKDPERVTGQVWEMVKSFLPVSHPLGMLPAIIKPTVEVSVGPGWDPFRDRHIVSPYMADRKIPADQFNKYTTETAKLIGKSLGLSPAKIDYIISNYTGGLGLQTIRFFENITTEQEFTRGPADWPAIGTLFSRDPRGRGYSVRRMYKRLHKLNQMHGSRVATIDDRRERRFLQMTVDRIRNIKRRLGKGFITPEEAAERTHKLSQRWVERFR